MTDKELKDYLYNDYVKQVLKKEIRTCKYTFLAVQRFVNDLEKSKDETYPYYFDEKEALKIVQFPEMFLKFYDGTFVGNPISLLPWQRFIYSNLYGWRRKDTKERRFRRAFIEVGRENGKSVMMDIGALYDILKTDGAQTCLVSNSAKQSIELFGKIKKVIGSNEYIKNALYFTNLAITNPLKNGTLQYFATDPTRLEGFHATYALIDELAAHKKATVLNTVWSGMGAGDKLMIIITTAGFNLNGPGYAEYLFAQKVIDGRLEKEDYFSIIYELDDGDDWEDEKNYIKVNPSLGQTLKLDTLCSLRDLAKSNPNDLREFQTKRLNQWTLSKPNNFIDDSIFVRVYNNKTISEEEKRSKKYPVSAGIDLSKRNDWSAFTLTFYKDDKYYNFHKFYIPENLLAKKEGTDSELIPQWVKEGKITLCRGDVIDYEYIYKDMDEAINEYGLKLIAVDRNYNAEELIERYKSKIQIIPLNISNGPIFTPTLRGYWYSVSEEKVIEENYNDKRTVIRWMNSNLGYDEDAKKNVFLKKEAGYAQSNQRIDGMMTSFYSYQAMQSLKASIKKPNRKETLKNIYSLNY